MYLCNILAFMSYLYYEYCIPCNLIWYFSLEITDFFQSPSILRKAPKTLIHIKKKCVQKRTKVFYFFVLPLIIFFCGNIDFSLIILYRITSTCICVYNVYDTNISGTQTNLSNFLLCNALFYDLFAYTGINRVT